MDYTRHNRLKSDGSLMSTETSPELEIVIHCSDAKSQKGVTPYFRYRLSETETGV